MSEKTEMSANQRQAAEADAAARRQINPPGESPAEPEPGASLALQALTLANEQGEDAATTVDRAKQYLTFLKENTDD